MAGVSPPLLKGCCGPQPTPRAFCLQGSHEEPPPQGEVTKKGPEHRTFQLRPLDQQASPDRAGLSLLRLNWPTLPSQLTTQEGGLETPEGPSSAGARQPLALLAVRRPPQPWRGMAPVLVPSSAPGEPSDHPTAPTPKAAPERGLSAPSRQGFPTVRRPVSSWASTLRGHEALPGLRRKSSCRIDTHSGGFPASLHGSLCIPPRPRLGSPGGQHLHSPWAPAGAAGALLGAGANHLRPGWPCLLLGAHPRSEKPPPRPPPSPSGCVAV